MPRTTDNPINDSLTLRLTAEQSRALKFVVERSGIKQAELLRAAVMCYVARWWYESPDSPRNQTESGKQVSYAEGKALDELLTPYLHLPANDAPSGE